MPVSEIVCRFQRTRTAASRVSLMRRLGLDALGVGFSGFMKK
jgi:hypothetical protein